MAPPALGTVKGCMYLPEKDWNAYQMWADYKNNVIERELGLAQLLGLNSLRVLASYEYWKENGPSFFAHVEHFLTQCNKRNIKPIMVLFEAPPKQDPAKGDLTDRNPNTSFGFHSPSRSEVLQPRNWDGYVRSPLHFTRRWAQEYGEDDRLLATEIMNEPGDVQPRQDFVKDMLREFNGHAPDATTTMGCKAPRFNDVYDTDDQLDVHQFHMNLPATNQRADEILREARDHAQKAGKPIWCTEWQRTREEPPSRFMPNYSNLGEQVYRAVDDGWIQGAYAWGLMLKPAYLKDPRELGRYNGIFHADGKVFDLDDAQAVGRDPNLSVAEKHDIPRDWQSHRFPYPRPQEREVNLAASIGKSIGFGLVAGLSTEGLTRLIWGR